MGFISGSGACYGCGRPFSFNPELVPSVEVDAVTGQLADATPVRPARTMQQPLCRPCVEQVNELRRQGGHPQILVPPGAYTPAEVAG